MLRRMSVASRARLSSAAGDAAQQPGDDRDHEQHQANPEQEIDGLDEPAHKRQDDRNDDDECKYSVHVSETTDTSGVMATPLRFLKGPWYLVLPGGGNSITGQ